MSTPDQALQTQLANLQKRAGKTIDQLLDVLRRSGLQKHGEMVAHLKNELGMGHGDANLVAHQFRAAVAPAANEVDDPLLTIYTAGKAGLRPLHDAVLRAVTKFGAFEIAPKKAYVSLRRDKQFAMVGPGTKGRLEIGLNLKGVEGGDRLVAQKSGGMCQFKVWLSRADEIDAELLGWLRLAFEAAG